MIPKKRKASISKCRFADFQLKIHGGILEFFFELRIIAEHRIGDILPSVEFILDIYKIHLGIVGSGYIRRIFPWPSDNPESYPAGIPFRVWLS